MDIPVDGKDYVFLTQVFNDSDTLCSGREKVVHLEKHNLKPSQ
jgi:hypothetical protein